MAPAAANGELSLESVEDLMERCDGLTRYPDSRWTQDFPSVRSVGLLS
jgi:hypothetical protein